MIRRYLKKQFMEYENYSGKKGYMVFREQKGMRPTGEYDSLGGGRGCRVGDCTGMRCYG